MRIDNKQSFYPLKSVEIGIQFQNLILNLQLIQANFYFMIQELTDIKMHDQMNSPHPESFRQDFQRSLYQMSPKKAQMLKNVKPWQDQIKFEENYLNSAANQQLLLRTFSRIKVIYMGASVVQTTIHISLIFIQCFSNKIEIKTLIFLTVASCLLLGILLVFLYNVQIDKINCELRNLEQIQKNNELPSLNQSAISKIGQKGYNRDAEKTKKIKFQPMNASEIERNLQTVKKLKNREKSSPQIVNDNFISKIIKKNCYINLSLISKIIQSIFIFILDTIFLTVVQNPKSDGVNTAVILIIICYIFMVLMLCGMLKLKQMNQQHIDQKVNNCLKEKIQEKIEEIIPKPKHQINKRISIDQAIQSNFCKKQFSIVQKKNTTSIHDCINSVNEPPMNKPETTIKNIEMVPKMMVKKSALKPQRSNLQKIQHCKKLRVELEVPERRKVEINSKKIQYFQYSYIQPSSSEIDNEINAKQDQKIQKLTLKNQKYFHKYNQQMQFLQKKKDANRAITSRQLKGTMKKQQIIKSEKIINQWTMFA